MDNENTSRTEAYSAFSLTKNGRIQLGANIAAFAREWGIDDFLASMNIPKQNSISRIVNNIDRAVIKMAPIASKFNEVAANITVEDFYTDRFYGQFLVHQTRVKVYDALHRDYCVVPMRQEHLPLSKPVHPNDYNYGKIKDRQSEARDTTFWRPDGYFAEGKYVPISLRALHVDVGKLRKHPVSQIVPATVKEIFFRPHIRSSPPAVFSLIVASSIIRMHQEISSPKL
ncbi:MAG: hypothetical protein AB7H77_08480 [Bdellovibrionales bacterium]